MENVHSDVRLQKVKYKGPEESILSNWSTSSRKWTSIEYGMERQKSMLIK